MGTFIGVLSVCCLALVFYLVLRPRRQPYYRYDYHDRNETRGPSVVEYVRPSATSRPSRATRSADSGHSTPPLADYNSPDIFDFGSSDGGGYDGGSSGGCDSGGGGGGCD